MLLLVFAQLECCRAAVSSPHGWRFQSLVRCPHALAHLLSLLFVFGVGPPLSGVKCSVNLYGRGSLSPTLMLVGTGEEELAL